MKELSPKYRRGVLLAVIVPLLLIGCDAFTDTPSAELKSSTFVIRVDHINAPDTTADFEPLHIWFEGTTGPDECHRFSHFDDELNKTALMVKLIGAEIEAGTCSGDPVPLRELYEVYPPFEETFSITVQQPDSSFLSKTVYFREPFD